MDERFESESGAVPSISSRPDFVAEDFDLVLEWTLVLVLVPDPVEALFFNRSASCLCLSISADFCWGEGVTGSDAYVHGPDLYGFGVDFRKRGLGFGTWTAPFIPSICTRLRFLTFAAGWDNFPFMRGV